MKHFNDQQDSMEIAARLKNIREAKGISREDVAAELGISPITYRKLENGNHNLTIMNLKKLSEILQVTTDLLLFGETGRENINFDEYERLARLFTNFKTDVDLIQRIQAPDQTNTSTKK